VTGEGWIQGNVASPCFENAKEPHKTVYRTLDTKTDWKVGTNSQLL
jgi:hypothetical protein